MSDKSKLLTGTNLSYNVVVIGDGAVGKTCMLISYTRGEFPKDYVPTVFDNYVVTVNVGDQAIDLSLKDTAGQEEYEKILKISFHGAHVFLVCFSIANPISFENIEPWVTKIRSFDPNGNIPYVLVGTQLDLRNHSPTLDKLRAKGMTPITTEQGLILQKKIKASAYVECSALTAENLNRVFSEAVSVILARRTTTVPHDEKCCVIL